MNEEFPSMQALMEDEAALQFHSFTNEDAWKLGCALVEAAQARQLPVAIDITRNGQQLFHAALAGSTADNDDWILRKSRVVQRFGHSSLAVGQLWRERGTTFEKVVGLDPQSYAAHGGAFPILIHSVGPVGTITVSGLPQVEDHQLVVSTIRAYLAE